MEKISPLHLSSYSAGLKLVHAAQRKIEQAIHTIFYVSVFHSENTEEVVARTRMMEGRKGKS